MDAKAQSNPAAVKRLDIDPSDGGKYVVALPTLNKGRLVYLDRGSMEDMEVVARYVNLLMGNSWQSMLFVQHALPRVVTQPPPGRCPSIHNRWRCSEPAVGPHVHALRDSDGRPIAVWLDDGRLLLAPNEAADLPGEDGSLCDEGDRMIHLALLDNAHSIALCTIDALAEDGGEAAKRSALLAVELLHALCRMIAEEGTEAVYVVGGNDDVVDFGPLGAFRNKVAAEAFASELRRREPDLVITVHCLEVLDGDTAAWLDIGPMRDSA